MTMTDRVNIHQTDFGSIISSIADSIVIVDQKGNICFANPSAEDFFCRNLKELLGKPFGFPLIKDQTTEIEVISKSGELRMAEMQMTESVLGGKKVYLASIRDFTELKRLEQGLRKQGSDLAERVKELSCLYRISKIIERPKASFEEMARGIVALIPPAWQYPDITCARIILNGQEFKTENFKETDWRQTSDIVVNGKQAGVLEVNYLEERPEKDEGPFSKEERSLIDAIAERLGHILDRIKGKEELQRTNRFLDSIIENIPNMIFLKDAKELRFIRFNRAGEDLLGYSRDDLLGKNDYDLFPKEQADWFTEKDQKVLREMDVIDIEEEPVRTRHKGERTLHTKKVPILNVEGEPEYLLGISEDITERKKLEAQFQQAQKMEAVGRLAGGVAHDFNNLLMTIMGNADLMLMGLAEDDPFREKLEQIGQNGKRAARLTRQLLAFSRKQILQPVALDLNELIKGFVKMLERLIGEDVELETVLVSGLRLVKADPGQVEQIIMNLVINARDAMPGGGKVIIETANADLDEDYVRAHDVSLQPGPYVMLAVSDTGTGMDEETRSNIFEPFFTTKEVGKGTGLGLSTVYGIVKQSGGYIWVYSEPGQGTTFKIYLPAVVGETVQRKKEQPPADDLTGSETILVVEDDDALRNLGREILERQGYRVLDAGNGIEALRISEAHRGQIHLMITDVVMPKMGGKKVADRSQPLYPQMKVIYMSGYTDNSIAHHGILAPGLNFLQKPFSPEVLARKVREVLDA